MQFKIIHTATFMQHLKKVEFKTKRIIEKKLLLAKNNPFRNKRIKGYNLFIFRIRVKDRRKEKRIIYILKGQFIILICILDRDKDYKDLKEYLKRF